MSTPTTTPARTGRVPLAVALAAGAVPILIIGQFAWLATVPVAIVLTGALADARLRVLRLPAVVLAATYALPYLIWRTRSDPAPSLSRDMDPVLGALVVAAAIIVIALLAVVRRGRTADQHTTAGTVNGEEVHS